ncbi:MAG: hypothetical protein JWO49_2476 [Arthrobacter sp.]|nr:hypothetical protein [Arthrobacter sp.]
MTILTQSDRPGAYTETDGAPRTPRTHPVRVGSYVDTDVLSRVASGSNRPGSYTNTDVLTRLVPGSGLPGSYADTDTTAVPRRA